MSKLKRLFIACAQVSLYLVLFLPAIVIYKRKHFWLISERGDDARDNGYWMFKFLREQHPEINSVYMIDPESVDAPKVQSLGPVLKKGCLKHWLVFIAADVRMSTHLFLFAPGSYAGQWIKKHHTSHSMNVDLNHGVNHNMYPSLLKEKNGSDLFICGAKPEADWIKANCRWDNSSLVYTGLARFDGLHNIKTKGQILIMPSWRTELIDVSDEEFKQSKYFQNWNALLSSQKLLTLVTGNNIEVVFYIHYSLKKFAHLFSTASSNIRCTSFEESDVQQLLRESKLLVTDYSSIFFDFAYMHKPLIYYQFDYEDFYSKHYQHGYFDHARDGFGPVVDNEEDLLEEIESSIRQGLVLDTKYEARINQFFPLYDAKNCERIYHAISTKQHENETN